jgi:plasmid stabilization system protein ParE
MARVHLSPEAKAEIRAVLRRTREEWGVRQAEAYSRLIAEARHTIGLMPTLGKARPEIAPDARTYHIGKPGRPARHLLAYHVLEDGKLVEVVAFLHDAMDFRHHWPRQHGREND